MFDTSPSKHHSLGWPHETALVIAMVLEGKGEGTVGVAEVKGLIMG